MKRNIAFTLFALVIVAAVVLAGCQGGGGSGGTTGGAGKTTDVTVTATEFKFTPDTITVKQGDHVRITLDNSKGSLTHDYVQQDLGIKIAADAGKTATGEFTASKTGTFQVICTQPGHKDAGMVGQIVVQP